MRALAKLIFMFVLLCTFTPLLAQSLAITDTESSEKHPGKFVWTDLLTNDVATAARFYNEVFGWQADYVDEDYLVLSHRGRKLGGIAKIQDPETDSNQWISFISTSDINKIHRYLTDVGVEVIVEPKLIEGRGEIGIYIAPDDAIFGVIDSASGDPGEVGVEFGQWIWIELWTTDTKIAADFYDDLGYEVVDNWTSDNEQDLLLTVGDIARAGLVQGHELQEKSIWLPYVLVESTQDTLIEVNKAGGRSRELEGNGKNHILLIEDPTGGLLAIVESPELEEDL